MEIAYERRDFFRNRFTPDELFGVLTDGGIAARDALSTRSRAYRSRQEEIDGLDEKALVAAMADEPTLLRRPLILSDRGNVVGFDRLKLEMLTRDRP